MTFTLLQRYFTGCSNRSVSAKRLWPTANNAHDDDPWILILFCSVISKRNRNTCPVSIFHWIFTFCNDWSWCHLYYRYNPDFISQLSIAFVYFNARFRTTYSRLVLVWSSELALFLRFHIRYQTLSHNQTESKRNIRLFLVLSKNRLTTLNTAVYWSICHDFRNGSILDWIWNSAVFTWMHWLEC